MEKLIIKNFGPIKLIELDVKKFTFLIGEQSSGKSTIAKLLSIVKDAFVVVGVISVQEKVNKLGLSSYFNKSTRILFQTFDYDFEIISATQFTISPKEQTLKDAVKQIKPFYKILGTLPTDTSGIVNDFIGTQGMNTSVYIPAERILISYITGRPFDYLNTDIKLPGHLSDFGKIFQDARETVGEFSVEWLNAAYHYSRGENWIVYNKKQIKMSESATGFQNVFPLLLAFERKPKMGHEATSYFIEEPELSLFPQTQYLLVKHLVQKCHSLNTTLLLTTHSPYVLSAFNNLIYAYNVGQKKPAKTKKIIPESLWIDPENVSAVYLNNRKATNLILEDLQQISVDEMDAISGVINDEFEALATLEVGKK